MRMCLSDGSIQLSQSAMDMYFTCPARFAYACRYYAKDHAEALKNGSDAHALLAGQEVADASPEAVAYYESLYSLAQKVGVEIHRQEFEQSFPIAEGVVFKRIIDGIGTWNGVPVVIDWKTSSSGPWRKVYTNGKYFSPKARTFQAVSYLIPPPGIDNWPEMMMFLVADTRGNGDVFFHQRDLELERNFMMAVDQMVYAIRNNSFPKFMGQPCGHPGTRYVCSFFDVCYQIPGWEESFEDGK